MMFFSEITLKVGIYLMKATKDMFVADVLNLDRGTIPIFFKHGLHCLGCSMSHGETLEEACQVHSLNLDQLLSDLNEHLASVGAEEKEEEGA
jgi:hybrid cluster-associated redox disulfide protein